MSELENFTPNRKKKGKDAIHVIIIANRLVISVRQREVSNVTKFRPSYTEQSYHCPFVNTKHYKNPQIKTMLFAPTCALFSVHHNLSSAWYFNFELPIDKIAPSRKIMKEKSICYGLVHLNAHMPPKAKRVVLGSSFWQTVPPHPLIFSTKILCWPFSRVFVLFCFLFVCLFLKTSCENNMFPEMFASLTVYGDMPVDWFCSKPS